MKIIKAKQSGANRVAYINASRIDSFYVTNMDESIITKIYFGDHKCEIEGDKTSAIAHFMSSDDDCGFLDLTEEERPRRCNRRLPDLDNSEVFGMDGNGDLHQMIFKGMNENGTK